MVLFLLVVNFFVSPETPKNSLEFVIRCFGGEVGWDGSGSKFNTTDLTITHQVVDRGTHKATHLVFNRVYIVPQYIYDSINSFKLLPAELYHPTAPLPPHLSPFHAQPNLDITNDNNEKTNNAHIAAMEEDVEENETKENEVEESDEMEENSSTSVSNNNNEEKELAKIMMTKKNKWLYKRMQFGIRKEEQKLEKLKEKKRAIQQGKLNVE